MAVFVLPGIYATLKVIAAIQIGLLAIQAIIATYTSDNGHKTVNGYKSTNITKGVGISPGLYKHLNYNSSGFGSIMKENQMNLNVEDYISKNQTSICLHYASHISLCLKIESLQFKFDSHYKSNNVLCLTEVCEIQMKFEVSPTTNIFNDEAMFYKLTGLSTTFETQLETSRKFKTGPGNHTVWWQPILLNLKGDIYYKDNQDDVILTSNHFEIDVYEVKGDTIVGIQGTDEYF